MKKQFILIPIVISLLIIFPFCRNQELENKTRTPITPQAVYTKDDPGNWAGKEDEHTPKVNVLSTSGRENVRVTVTLSDASESHFIEKIFIAETSGRPWQEKYFPRKNMASTIDQQAMEKSNEIPGGENQTASGRQYSATFTIPVDKTTAEKYRVYARCSQHDLWSVPLK